jgi:hypothetical protein
MVQAESDICYRMSTDAFVDREGLEEASCECDRAAPALPSGVTSASIANP